MFKVKWTESWSKVPGWYWFYGIRFNQIDKPDLYMVKVRKAVNGMIYIAGGCFLYKAEGAKGKFCKAIVPKV